MGWWCRLLCILCLCFIVCVWCCCCLVARRKESSNSFFSVRKGHDRRCHYLLSAFFYWLYWLFGSYCEWSSGSSVRLIRDDDEPCELDDDGNSPPNMVLACAPNGVSNLTSCGRHWAAPTVAPAYTPIIILTNQRKKNSGVECVCGQYYRHLIPTDTHIAYNATWHPKNQQKRKKWKSIPKRHYLNKNREKSSSEWRRIWVEFS